MNLGPSETVEPVLRKLRLFIQEAIIPNEQRYLDELHDDRWQILRDARQGSSSVRTRRTSSSQAS